MINKFIIFFLIINVYSCNKNREFTKSKLIEDHSSNEIEYIKSNNKETKKCPDTMTEISGDYCIKLEEICLEWGDTDNPRGPAQCLKFKQPTKCLSDTKHMHYCIDTIPYPYNLDEKPATNMTWYQAKKICEDQGKRLCNIKEFTQACRGPENKPYPYGYSRDCKKCNCDRGPWLDPETHSFEELDKRLPIKDIIECKSDYGIISLVGNNDRWVYNENEKPYKSALVGGHAIKGARNRCTATTLVHFEMYAQYQAATPLCCKDID